MAKEQKHNLPKRSEDFSGWYNELCLLADLADYAPVKGCMVIKPYGYAIWENIKNNLDERIKQTGHVNAYFPLFIPEAFLQKEKEHVEGFSPELAVVTQAGGKELRDKLVVRPTSETIMYDMYAKWIKSYRDLPVMINQWANVVRWELRTRLFLRTSEFLWQEGHTAHATHEEAEGEALRMLGVYKEFAEQMLALPVLSGPKSESEKFAGAARTYAIEAMMQDGKALQCGTSHDLGQNFAKSFDIKYLDKNNKEQYVWQTSWGVSTRLIGAVIMAHGDDYGLVLPPAVAPYQVVIVVIGSGADKAVVLSEAKKIKEELGDYSVHIDDRELSPGWKFTEWELKGAPLRIEIGKKDLAENKVVVARRDKREKYGVERKNLKSEISSLLLDIQAELYKNALAFREEHIYKAASYNELKDKVQQGFVLAPWCGSEKCEEEIKAETKATIRVSGGEAKDEKCAHCGKEAREIVYFARAY